MVPLALFVVEWAFFAALEWQAPPGMAHALKTAVG
jgi:hypothetical protein